MRTNHILYLVTDSTIVDIPKITHTIQQAIEGGVTIVQLRYKNISTNLFYMIALSVKEITKNYNIPLIINDRIDIALAINADGLHIGQSDMPFSVARRLLGKNKIIGLSVETIEQAKTANGLGVDYIGISPVFFTQTKLDIAKPLGIDGVKKIASFSKHPIVCIGGINESNAKVLIDAGADGIAVVSAIFNSSKPKEAAISLIKTITKL
tara:strand:- start:68563 stop:69189 length:627 start_codon:yes stop_codon:yes gene_type:complete